jgi:hypothetical protein
MFSGLLQAAKNSPFSSPLQQAQCAPREQKSVNMAAVPSGNLVKFVFSCQNCLPFFNAFGWFVV